jgi:hypothetical protein
MLNTVHSFVFSSTSLSFFFSVVVKGLKGSQKLVSKWLLTDNKSSDIVETTIYHIAGIMASTMPELSSLGAPAYEFNQLYILSTKIKNKQIVQNSLNKIAIKYLLKR